jgi:hypothetical protein
MRAPLHEGNVRRLLPAYLRTGCEVFALVQNAFGSHQSQDKRCFARGEVAVAEVRTSEECAQSLVTIFKDFKTHAGEVIPRDQLETAFHAAGGGGADYEAAMLCAIERHWIKVENDVARLTESGSVAAR